MMKRVLAAIAMAAVASACGPSDGDPPIIGPVLTFPSPEFSDPGGASPSSDPSLEPSIEPLPTGSVAPNPPSVP